MDHWCLSLVLISAAHCVTTLLALTTAAAQSVGAQSVLLAAAGSGSHTLLRWLLLHSLAASDQTRIFSDQWIYLIHHLWAQRNKFFLQFYHSIFFFKSWCIKDPKLRIMKYPGLGRGLWLCLLLPTRLISQNDVCHTHRSSENTSNNCSTFFILFSDCRVEKDHIMTIWRHFMEAVNVAYSDYITK